jgi:hypothetical protein
MDALDVESRIAAGEQALQALITCVRERAGKLEAHEAEQGLFTRRRPMGLAAMQRYVAQRGTGEGGPAITRADGGIQPREPQLRRRAYGSRFGTCAVARTCDRTPGAPGSFPLDAQVNPPERCASYFLQAWRPLFAVAHPGTERADCLAQLCARDVAESVGRAVAQEAPEDDEGFYAQRPVPHQDPEGARLVGSFDGTGVPRITAEAVKLQAKWGTGEKRQRQKAALVGAATRLMPNHGRPKRSRHSWGIRKPHVRGGRGQG